MNGSGSCIHDRKITTKKRKRARERKKEKRRERKKKKERKREWWAGHCMDIVG